MGVGLGDGMVQEGKQADIDLLAIVSAVHGLPRLGLKLVPRPVSACLSHAAR